MGTRGRRSSSKDLGEFLIRCPFEARWWAPAPRQIGAVNLDQAGSAVCLRNWEDLASVEFGHDLHRRFRDRCESMSCIGRDDHDVSRATSPSVGANRHIDLSRQDVQDLLAMVQVQRSALTSAKLTSRQHDSTQPLIAPGN